MSRHLEPKIAQSLRFFRPYFLFSTVTSFSTQRVNRRPRSLPSLDNHFGYRFNLVVTTVASSSPYPIKINPGCYPTGDEFSCLWRDCTRSRRPFNARYKLLIHMRVHSGHKPNRCHVSIRQNIYKAFYQ